MVKTKRHINKWLLKRFLRLGARLFDAHTVYNPNDADTWAVAFYDTKRVRDVVFWNRGDSKAPRHMGKTVKTENGK